MQDSGRRGEWNLWSKGMMSVLQISAPTAELLTILVYSHPNLYVFSNQLAGELCSLSLPSQSSLDHK